MNCAPLPESHVADIRRMLIDWYREEHRALPWRTAPSEYGTVVSEFMLQQTQVATVVPYYHAFLEQFPTFADLAEADEDAVLLAWSGLGYYRRARLLKRLAETVVREHNGRLPRDPEALMRLPGLGPYTRGAVGSIALGLALPLVDGNVRRVVGRLFALGMDLMRGEGKRELWRLCEQLVDPEHPGDFNQGLMELGATICTPREPLCLACPLYTHCRARAAGFPEQYPLKTKRPRRIAVREVAVALIRNDKVLVLQRGEEGAFAGMWELPRLDAREVLEENELNPQRVLFDLIRVRPSSFRMLGQTESTFTHHLIQTELYAVEDSGGQAVRRQRHVAHKWLGAASLERLPASRAQRRLFGLLRDVSPEEG